VSQRSFHCIFILSGINSCLNQTNEHNKGKRIQKTKRCKSSLLRSIKCTVIITHNPTLHGFFTFTAKTTPTHPQTQSRTYTLVNLETFDERRISGYGAELYPHKPDMYLPFRFPVCSFMFIYLWRSAFFSHSSLRKVSRKPKLLNRMWCYCCFYFALDHFMFMWLM